jgi:hypothetical protein
MKGENRNGEPRSPEQQLAVLAARISTEQQLRVAVEIGVI